MDELSQAGEDAQLCLVCGLCCDGTLFKSINLDEFHSPESPHSCEIKNGLDQPCPEHTSQGCRIYADRPKVCREFRCALLISCDKKEISFAEARKQILRAQSLRNEMLQALLLVEPRLQEASLAKAWSNWKEMTKSEEGLVFRNRCGQALLQLAALRLYLERHFLEASLKPPSGAAS